MTSIAAHNRYETRHGRVRWTGDLVLDGIKALHGAGVSLSNRDLQWNEDERVSEVIFDAIGARTTGAKLHSAAGRIFGSFAKAVTAAGLEPKAFRQVPRFWTKPLILRCIRNLHAAGIELNVGNVTANDRSRVDTVLLVSTDVKTNGKALYHATLKRFGSWDKALADAQMIPAKIRQKGFLTPEVILEAIRALDNAGICPSYSEMQRGGESTIKVIRSITGRRSTGVSVVLAAKRHFGSWDGALIAAGIDPTRVRKDRFWTRELIGKCLSRLADAQVPLNGRAINLDASSETTALLRPIVARDCTGSALFQAARLHFESWDEALSTAGLDPVVIRRKGFWTRASIRKSIIALNDKSVPLNVGKISKNRENHVSKIIEESIGKFSTGEGLHRAGRDIFGSWDNAMKEAGLEPRKIRSYGPRWRRTTLTRIIQALHASNVPLNVGALRRSQNDVRSDLLRSFSGRDMAGETLYRLGKMRFGTWDKALRGADLDPCQIRLKAESIERDLERVTGILKIVHENGFSLNIGAVRAKSRDIRGLTYELLERVFSGYSLMGAGIAVTGSWDATLRAANFDPFKIRLRFPATSNIPIIPHQVERIRTPDGKVRKVTYLGSAPKIGDELLDEQRLADALKEALSDLSPEDQSIVAQIYDLLDQDETSSNSSKDIQTISSKMQLKGSEDRISRIFAVLRSNERLREFL